MVRLRSLGIVTGALTLFSSGCLKPGADVLASLVSTDSGAVVTTTENEGDLYLIVSSAWESTPDEYTDQITCTIPEGSASTTLTCSGSIPEGELHYSKLKFTLGSTNSSACKMLIFKPYYYLASTNVAFVPPWDPTGASVDCTASPIPAGCYDGVAKEIVDDFPTYTGMYFLTSEGQETSYEVDSANEMTHPSNRWTANNKVDKTAAVANYEANTMVDYVVECRDQYYQLQKQITLTIHDADLETGEDPGTVGSDDFDDWLAP